MGEDDAQLTWPRSTQWPAGKDQADERALIRRELRPLVHTINKAIKQADGQLMLRSLRELIAQTEAREVPSELKPHLVERSRFCYADLVKNIE